MNPVWDASTDLVVIGSGIAGLTAALDAAQLGLRVVVVTKDLVDAGSTRWAQGGVAVVVGDVPGDSVAAHVADTLTAGAGLCDAAAVVSILADGPRAVARLRARGAVFDADPRTASLARTREGGHSALRVVHAGGDATGAEIERSLVAAARDRGMVVLTGHVAVDALLDAQAGVAGVALLDDEGRPGVLHAPAVLLATGGYGQLYSSTTNPETSTGDGIALALRAGATAADLEFVQFHPTVLFAEESLAGSRIGTEESLAGSRIGTEESLAGSRIIASESLAGRRINPPPATGQRPLISEAVRGEGAVLRDRAGRRFMTGVHPLADLAPRDIVAAAISRRMAETGADCVYLDARALDGFARRFPTVYSACRAAGIDPVREPIPVSPAAHYSCGGVVTDLDGRTAVAGLYAAGEVARTGLHGANRLASNSLLEGLVVGARAARAVAADLSRRPRSSGLAPAVEVCTAPRELVQGAMTAAAGIGRDAAGLAAASDIVEAVLTPAVPADRAGVEDAALALLAQAVLAAAGTRTESRGCHVRSDFPERDDVWQQESLVIGLDPGGRPVVQSQPAAVGAR